MQKRPARIAGHLAELAARVDARLPELLPDPSGRPASVLEAMRYALTGRGKRLRPALTLSVAEMFGRPGAPVLDLACAVEMVHACSLVFDDLPAMDGAELRRGRPTVHRQFGEDVAQLAGLALLSRAYAVVAEAGQRLALVRYTVEDMTHHLAAAIGTSGLIGGQALDLECARGGKAADGPIDLATLEYIHSHKTGALFIAAGELGAMAVDARRRDLELITRYAKNLGLAFQISDDLLDVLGSTEVTGKDSHQDDDKVTFVKLLGVEGAQTLAAELLAFAVASLEPLGRKATVLRELAEFVRERGH